MWFSLYFSTNVLNITCFLVKFLSISIYLIKIAENTFVYLFTWFSPAFIEILMIHFSNNYFLLHFSLDFHLLFIINFIGTNSRSLSTKINNMELLMIFIS